MTRVCCLRRVSRWRTIAGPIDKCSLIPLGGVSKDGEEFEKHLPLMMMRQDIGACGDSHRPSSHDTSVNCMPD